MRKALFILSAILLAGCAPGEPQAINKPVTVDQMREAAKTEERNSKTEMPDLKSQIEVAEAVAESRNEPDGADEEMPFR